MEQRYTQASDFWRERDFGQKISAAFEFIGAHWRPLGRVMLYLVMPAALLHVVLNGIIQSNVLDSVRGASYRGGVGSGSVFGTRMGMYNSMFSSPLYYVSNFFGVAFYTVLVLSIYGYVLCCVYPPHPGQPVEVADVWAVVKRRFIGTFFSFYGVWIIIALAFIVLFIPGIYMSVVLSLFFVVSVMEDTGFGATINRCVSLTKGKWWSTFGLLFILGLLLWVLFAGIGIATALFGSGMRGVFSFVGAFPMVALIIANLFSLLVTLLFYPPMMLALAFQYFNLVERHEGVGMHQLVSQLGQPQPAGPSDTTYRPDDEGEY